MAKGRNGKRTGTGEDSPGTWSKMQPRCLANGVHHFLLLLQCFRCIAAVVAAVVVIVSINKKEEDCVVVVDDDDDEVPLASVCIGVTSDTTASHPL